MPLIPQLWNRKVCGFYFVFLIFFNALFIGSKINDVLVVIIGLIHLKHIVLADRMGANH